MHMSIVHAWNADCTNAVSGGTEGQLPGELGTRCVVELTPPRLSAWAYEPEHSNPESRTVTQISLVATHSLFVTDRSSSARVTAFKTIAPELS